MKFFKLFSCTIILFFFSISLLSLTQDEETLLDASLFGDGDVIEKLLDKNVNVNVQDDVGNTALILASIEGHITVVDMLLKANARKDILNKHGMSALDYARDKRRKEVIKMLEK